MNHVALLAAVKNSDGLKYSTDNTIIVGYKVIVSTSFTFIYYDSGFIKDPELNHSCLIPEPSDIIEVYYFKVSDYPSGLDAERAAKIKVAELYKQMLED